MNEPLPIGSRVRLRDSGRVGTIIGYEWREPGVLSGLPYRVEWEDGALWPAWPNPESIEEVRE